jgi:hypothetical protein
MIEDFEGTGGSVIRFTDVIANGDILSPALSVEADVTYEISFDYLGLCKAPPGGLGGFIGLSDDLSFQTSHIWIGGTEPGQARNMLIDDGEWHSYSFSFTPSGYFDPTGGTVRLMLEDFEDTAPYTAEAASRDAYFDNIRVVKP